MSRFRIEHLRRVFRFATFAVGSGLLVVMGFLYLRYGDLIVGNIRLEEAPSLLKKLETQKLEQALQRYQARKETPPLDPAIANPFRP
jgi:hypothetical protein